MKRAARRVLKGLETLKTPEIKDNNSSTHDRVFWVTLSDGTKKMVAFPFDDGEDLLAEGMSDVLRTSSIPSNDIARESAVRATNADLPTMGEVAATRRDRRIEEERTNPNYYEDKEKEYTLLAVDERMAPYNWMLTVADGLDDFRRALGMVTTIPEFGYIGLPMSIGNALIDKYYYGNDEAANEDLLGAIIGGGVPLAGKAGKAFLGWKRILPALRFVNGKVIAPAKTWATTTLYPWMRSAATKAKKLLPSWTDSAADASADASRSFNWHFELTPDGKLVLVDTPVESSALYSPNKNPETYAVELFHHYKQHPESFKGIAEEIPNTPEGKAMVELVVKAWNDMIEYLRSPQVKARIEELKKEAAANNYSFDFDPEEYLKAVQHLEINNFASDTGGVAAAVPNANTRGVMVLNSSSPLFTETPYATALHESVHLDGLGNMAKSLGGPEYVKSLPFLYFKVGLFFGKRASSEAEVKQILADIGCPSDCIDYFANPSEFIAFGLSLGLEVGLKLGQRYPGKAAAEGIIQKIGAKLYNQLTERTLILSMFYEVIKKAGNGKENIKNIWDLLTGQYLFTFGAAAAIGAGLGISGNNNINNDGYETKW